MATSYTTFLGLALPVTGELSGTWGDTVNNYISNYLDAAIAGAQTVTTDTTLTKTTGSSLGSTSSQYAIIIASPASANITITAPAASKIYTIINTSATYTVTIRGAGPTTGVTLGVSEKAQVAWNGSDFVRIGASGGPGVFSSITNTGLTSGRVVYSTTGGLETDSANLLFNGTTLTANTLNLTNALGTTYGGTGLTSFTSGGVVYASSSSALTTGSALTFDGTNFVVGGSAVFAKSTVVQSLSGSTAAFGISDNATTTMYMNNVSSGVSGWWSSGALAFGTNNGTFSEQMRLTSTGLGIGTSSPGYKLHVVGNALVTPSGGWTTSGVATQYFGDIYGSIKYDYNTTNFLISSYGSFSIATNGTSPTTRLIVDVAGNLGLGVTPSAWVAYKALQVGSTGGALSSSSSSDFEITTNAYYSGGWLSQGAGVASSRYRLLAGAHAWFNAPSGTAGNAITFTQAMTLDASGRLSLGGTYSASGAAGYSNFLTVTGSNPSITLANGGGSNSIWQIGTAGSGGGWLAFYDAINSSERMRLDSSGNLLVGTTTSIESGKLSVYAVGGTGFGVGVNSSGSGIVVTSENQSNTCTAISFKTNYGLVGSITCGSSTLYNVTSDQRLKENIQDAESSSSLIDSLQVRKFDWKTDQTHQRYGFIAQELVTVAPEAVHQPADPDEMMAVDYSKLVPMLVKEIQSLRIRIAQLEAK